MDPKRFDRLIRDLIPTSGVAASRRSLVSLVASGLLTAGLLRMPEAEAKGKKCKKKSGKLKCDGVCIDPQTDVSNCGSCGNVCGQGQTCQGGTCGGGGGGDCDPSCGFNTVCADGTCVAAANICAGPTGICDADPTPCGTAANGEICGCEATVEGNTFCANAVDACTTVECTTSQDCFEFGFHFFCQEAKTNANGQFCGCGFGTATGRVCVAECDNPNVAFTKGGRKPSKRRT
jgi:hypothetical protein